MLVSNSGLGPEARVGPERGTRRSIPSFAIRYVGDYPSPTYLSAAWILVLGRVGPPVDEGMELTGLSDPFSVSDAPSCFDGIDLPVATNKRVVRNVGDHVSIHLSKLSKH